MRAEMNMNDSASKFNLLRLAAVAMLLWAEGKHGYGYYVVLRWVVCTAGMVTAVFASGLGNRNWFWTFVVVAILFNPFLPAHFDRDTWALIDIVVAVLIALSMFAVPFRETPPRRSESNDSSDERP